MTDGGKGTLAGVWSQRWGGSVIGQDKVNTARQGTARTFPSKPFGFSHGQRTVRAVRRGTDRPAPFSQRNRTPECSYRAAFRLLSRQGLIIFAGAVLIATLATGARVERLVLVATDSSCPIGIYRIVHKPLAHGELIEACLPAAIARYGMARGYIRSGTCTNGSEPVIKIIGATAGDQVELSREAIRVNDIALPGSITRSVDTRGRSVRSIARGAYLTSANEVWILGLHDARSWDSRYFGPIPRESIVGAVQPVFALPTVSRSK